MPEWFGRFGRESGLVLFHIERSHLRTPYRADIAPVCRSRIGLAPERRQPIQPSSSPDEYGSRSEWQITAVTVGSSATVFSGCKAAQIHA